MTAPQIVIRDLRSIDELIQLKAVEKAVWAMDDEDAIPLTLAIALKTAGNIFVGAFDQAMAANLQARNPQARNPQAGNQTPGDQNVGSGAAEHGSGTAEKEKQEKDRAEKDKQEKEKLVGFAFGFLGREHGQMTIHSHMLAVLDGYRHLELGTRLKQAQRERALAMGVHEMTWTFDPLQSRNAHFNFAKLGVLAETYKVDFYGPETSSVLHRNGTDRLWVRWMLDSRRVRDRIAGKSGRTETMDALRLLAPLVRFDGKGKPVRAELGEALGRERVGIEIPETYWR